MLLYMLGPDHENMIRDFQMNFSTNKCTCTITEGVEFSV